MNKTAFVKHSDTPHIGDRKQRFNIYQLGLQLICEKWIISHPKIKIILTIEDFIVTVIRRTATKVLVLDYSVLDECSFIFIYIKNCFEINLDLPGVNIPYTQAASFVQNTKSVSFHYIF